MHLCVDIKRWTFKEIIKRKLYKFRIRIFRFISLNKPYKMRQDMIEMRIRSLRHFSKNVYKVVETNKIWLKGLRIYHPVNVEHSGNISLALPRNILFVKRFLELVKKWDTSLDETLVTTSRFNKSLRFSMPHIPCLPCYIEIRFL